MIYTAECPCCRNTKFSRLITARDFAVTQEDFTIKFCNSCGLGITDPRPKTEQLSRYYESPDYISHAAKATTLLDRIYTAARSIALKRKWKLLNRFTKPKSVLDYGCGTGSFLQYVKSKGVVVCGVEPSDKARNVALNALGDISVYPTLDRVNKTFDAITLWHVLEHIPEPAPILRKLKQILDPNGCIFIAVPNITSWDSHHYKEKWAALDTPRHLWHFNRHSLKLLLESSGFQLTSIEPMTMDSYYVSLLSEKYNRGNKQTLTGLIAATLNGYRSNRSARKTNEYSSLIYIAKHA